MNESVKYKVCHTYLSVLFRWKNCTGFRTYYRKVLIHWMFLGQFGVKISQQMQRASVGASLLRGPTLSMCSGMNRNGGTNDSSNYTNAGGSILEAPADASEGLHGETRGEQAAVLYDRLRRIRRFGARIGSERRPRSQPCSLEYTGRNMDDGRGQTRTRSAAVLQGEKAAVA